MAKQLVPNVASFRVVQTHLGAAILNTVYVRNTATPWTVAQLQLTADAIRAAWIANMLPLQTTSLTFNRVDAEDLGADPGNTAQSISGAPGTRAGDPATAALAINVALLGASGVFPRRGRFFFAGLTETDMSGDNAVGAYVASCTAAFQALQTAIGGAVPFNAQVIVSRSQQTAAQTADIKAKREALKAAIAAARRATGISNTIATISAGAPLAVQRDRRT